VLSDDFLTLLLDHMKHYLEQALAGAKDMKSALNTHTLSSLCALLEGTVSHLTPEQRDRVWSTTSAWVHWVQGVAPMLDMSYTQDDIIGVCGILERTRAKMGKD